MVGDPHWDDVVFLSGFEGGSPIDESQLAQTVSVHGGASLSSAQAVFGTQSLLCVTNDAVSVPDHASFAMGSGPWTVETFIRFSAFPMNDYYYLMGQWDWDTGDGAPGWALAVYYGASPLARYTSIMIDSDGDGFVDAEAVGELWDPAVDTWYHYCAEYDGTDYRVYIDGVMLGKETASYPVYNSTAPMMFGAIRNSGSVESRFQGYLDEVRVTVGTARYASDSGFAVPTEAYPRSGEDPLDTEIAEGIGMFAGVGPGGIFHEVVIQGVRSHLDQLVGQTATPTDDIGVTYGLQLIKASPVSAQDGVGINVGLSDIRGVVMLERLQVAMAQVPNHKFHFNLNQGIGSRDMTRVGVPVALAETIGTAAQQQAQLSIQVIEELGLLPAIGPALIYNRTIAEAIGLASSLASFFGANVSEAIGVASTLTSTAIKPATVAEGIGIDDGLSPQLIIRVTAIDGIGLDDVDVLQMIYSPEIAEGISLTAAYLSPGGGITTWAMNTRTAAVTEYSNYEFNSFARLGSKYIGASQDGLYELAGDDDEGTDVIAEIKSGFAQWAGSRFTVFKGAYLAVRGGGNFVLKLITGDDKEYVYGIAARDMRSTKIRLGKGIRTRYFRFELISTGQDFDLEALEFVPLVAERRV